MRFEYIARDKTGKVYKGAIEAPNEEAARAKLQQMGFFVTRVKAAPPAVRLGKGRVKAQDLVVFTEQLSVMINAGLPIMRSLHTIGAQTESKILKQVVDDIVRKLDSGSSLSEALAQYPQVFSDLYVNLVKAGETGGIIDKVLMKISEHLHKEAELKRNLIKAFAYPVIVGVVAFIVVTFLVVFIIPVFAETYQKMGLSLPLPTLALMAMSELVRKFWWLLVMGISGIIFLYKLVERSVKGRQVIDNFKLNLPVFGKLNRKVLVARFVSTLGLLVSSGISVMEALAVMRGISSSMVMVNMIDRLRGEIKQGKRIGDSLSGEKLLPPMTVQMIAAGEESGDLATMLKKSADFLERDIDVMVQRLVVRLEPILTFALALVVGFIALAIYLPMFDVISNIAKK